MQLSLSSSKDLACKQACFGSRQRMRCTAVTRSSAVAPTQPDRSSELSSKLAAALSGVLIASSVFSPAAIAESKLAEQVADAVERTSKAPQKLKLRAVDETFQNSPTLKALLEKSDANRAKNKKSIQNKYCYRQAEMGIGDCGGLRYIPGMTKSGKQKTPEWLQKVLGVDGKIPKVEGEGKTIEELLGPDFTKE